MGFAAEGVRRRSSFRLHSNLRAARVRGHLRGLEHGMRARVPRKGRPWSAYVLGGV